MIHLFVWILFLSGVAINLALLARLDPSRLDFLDGILIGQAYYVIVPLLVFLIEGQTEISELSIAYRPFADLATTGMLICGLYLFPILRLLFPPPAPDTPDTSDARMPLSVVILFVVTALASFLLTGLAGGGHWQDNLAGAFANPAFLPIKYAANVTRNAVFAVLLYQVATGRMRTSHALLAGLALAAFDVLTTFNRITAVYLLILGLLLLKRSPLRMVLAGLVSLSGLSAISALWPAFRGLATMDGYSRASFMRAWDAARRAGEAAPASLDASLNAVFESSNLVVLNWIVEHYGTSGRPFLGLAIFARPLTLFVPGSIWSGRPQNFGLALGDGIAQIPSLALNSTLYGESYANFGWFWPLGLSTFVMLWHGAFRLMAPQARVVQAIGAFTAIAMWRFDASFVGCAVLLTAALTGGLWLTQMRYSAGRHPTSERTAWPA